MMQVKKDKNNQVYTLTDRENATHILLTTNNSSAAERYQNICMPILEKIKYNVIKLNLKDQYSNDLLNQTTEYTVQNSNAYCKLHSPVPTTIEDVRKYLLVK